MRLSSFPWVGKLRRVVFLGGRNWMGQDLGLYRSMKEILREAQKDPEVLED